MLILGVENLFPVWDNLNLSTGRKATEVASSPGKTEISFQKITWGTTFVISIEISLSPRKAENNWIFPQPKYY